MTQSEYKKIRNLAENSMTLREKNICATEKLKEQVEETTAGAEMGEKQ